MSWNTFHNRGEILRVVVETANERCDGVLPTEVPGVAENFADDLDLIGALQLKWHARLSGNIERALVREPMDPESAVTTAWRTTAEQLPGLRAVLDRAAEQSAGPETERAMARATHLEQARLATAAGLASGRSDAAAAVGQRIERRARESWVQAPAPVPARESAERRSGGTLADRIRAALAA